MEGCAWRRRWESWVQRFEGICFVSGVERCCCSWRVRLTIPFGGVWRIRWRKGNLGHSKNLREEKGYGATRDSVFVLALPWVGCLRCSVIGVESTLRAYPTEFWQSAHLYVSRSIRTILERQAMLKAKYYINLLRCLPISCAVDPSEYSRS